MLGDIAKRLVTCVPEPLHCEFVRLSALCRRELDLAAAQRVLKNRMLQSVPPP